MDAFILSVCGLVVLLCFLTACRIPDYGISPIKTVTEDVAYLETVRRYQSMMFSRYALPARLLLPKESEARDDPDAE